MQPIINKIQLRKFTTMHLVYCFLKKNEACISEVVESQKNMLKKFKLYHRDLNSDSISRISHIQSIQKSINRI